MKHRAALVPWQSKEALNLAAQDYDLSAIFMRNWDTRDESGTDQGCEWKKDWEDVQRVCRMLGIRCQMVRPSCHRNIDLASLIRISL